jgi:threonine/homoserine/homoserine lactone efflux protein
MIFKGFKFGMLLQIAVGPVSIFVFNMANRNGFFQAEMSAFAVTIVDALYILLAILGIASLLEKDKVKAIFKIFGAIILVAFGINIILGVFGIEILHSLNSIENVANNGLNNAFVLGFIITASNPLTILFWTGVFASKITEENMIRKDLFLFGIGAIIPTLVSQTIFALIGSLTKKFMPDEIVSILNIFVGASLLYFAIKLLRKKERCLQ